MGDVIMLIFALAVCACIFAAIIGVVIVSILEPNAEVGVAASSLGTLLSAITGFVIGKAIGKNGQQSH